MLKRLAKIAFVVSLIILVGSVVPILLSIWGILPWFGLGGKLFITAYTVGFIACMFSAWWAA